MGVANEMGTLDGISGKALQSELTWFADKDPSPLCPPHFIMLGITVTSKAYEASVRLEDNTQKTKHKNKKSGSLRTSHGEELQC